MVAPRERLMGYRRALAMRDLPADPALIVRESWQISGGTAALPRLRQLPDSPTAVCCCCDRTALGAYTGAATAWLRLPGDLPVIGFGNESFTAGRAPPLTTTEPPQADMARHAVEKLQRTMARPGSGPRHARLKFDCPMIPRASVARPGAAAPLRAEAAARG